MGASVISRAGWYSSAPRARQEARLEHYFDVIDMERSMLAGRFLRW